MTEQQTATDNKENWQLVANTGWLAGQSFTISKHAVLGRDADCDITIPGTHLSRRHAEIAVSGDKLLVRDLGSANGTYVNEQLVTEAEMHPGDTIRFDVLTFTIMGPAQVTKPQAVIDPASNKAANPQANAHIEKPSSLGNRDKTVHITAIQKTSNALTVVGAIALGLGCLGALGYLIMQL